MTKFLMNRRGWMLVLLAGSMPLGTVATCNSAGSGGALYLEHSGGGHHYGGPPAYGLVDVYYEEDYYYEDVYYEEEYYDEYYDEYDPYY